jgi:hypothetical protein
VIKKLFVKAACIEIDQTGGDLYSQDSDNTPSTVALQLSEYGSGQFDVIDGSP